MRIRFFILQPVLLVLFLMFFGTSCTAPARSPTLVFDDTGCRYQGPLVLPPQFNMTWVIEENSHDAFIYAIVQLKDNKTIKDLAIMQGVEPPPDWMQKLGFALDFDPGTSTQQFDLQTIYRFDPANPIYIVCFFTDEDTAMGAAGPIRIASGSPR